MALKLHQRIAYSGYDQEKVNELTELYKSVIENGNQNAKDKLDEELKNTPELGFTLKWHQRSVDTFLGLPFNIASYALLAMIIEGLTGYKAVGLIADLSNVHFYEPHIKYGIEK